MDRKLIDDIRAISVIERILFLQRMLKDAEQERKESDFHKRPEARLHRARNQDAKAGLSKVGI